MNKDQILKLAKKYLESGEHSDDGYCSPDWFADNEQLLKFAQAVYDKGRDDEAELYVDENY